MIWILVTVAFLIYAFKPHFKGWFGGWNLEDEVVLQRREESANRALYAVDPALAIELGYTPPEQPKGARFTTNNNPLGGGMLGGLSGMIGGGLGKHAETQQRYSAALNSYYEQDKQLAIQEMFKARRQQILQQRKNNEH